MNQQEINNFFEIERKKHFDFFLPYYNDKNWQIIKDNIDSGNKNDWDVIVEPIVGQYKKIDEKVRIIDYGDCLIEILQDLETGTLGWYFGDKDWVLYGSWNDILEIQPVSLYLIKITQLRKHLCGQNKFFKTCISKKGWGITWNVICDWQDLINKKIAEKLI